MKSSLFAFKIGLAGIGIFVISLVIYVGAQAGATKQDTQTYSAASSIADKLNTYVYDQSMIPASLQVAGVSSVPSTISYTKLSDASFKFCVTYKTKDNGFGGSTSLVGTIAAIESPTFNSGSSSNGTLYVSLAHKKGENCQTITPPFLSNFSSGSSDTLGNNYNGNSFSNPSDTYQLTDPTQVD